jgi:hypothetical protein
LLQLYKHFSSSERRCPEIIVGIITLAEVISSWTSPFRGEVRLTKLEEDCPPTVLAVSRGSSNLVVLL